METISPALLVLGSHDSGKSTYRAQVYQRVEHFEGELQLTKSVKAIGSLEADVERLNQGLQLLHTNSEVYHSTALALSDRSGREIILEFADYGGEQIKNIGNNNLMPVEWLSRAQNSTSWLYLIRIDQLRPQKDFMTSHVHSRTVGETSEQRVRLEISPQINAIETLQRLLFARGTSIRHPLETPRLGILLSCWDELAEDEQKQTAEEILKRRAPLFFHYLKSNWKAEELKLWALSSTEKSLPPITPDLDFIVNGPQNVGYIIDSNKPKSPDLTIPIVWLLKPR